MIAALDKAERLERLYKVMVEEITDYAIILLDMDGTILTWNKGAERIKGYKKKEILGKNFSVFYTQEDQNAGIPQQMLEQAAREGRAKYIGTRVKKGGEQFWGSMLLTALHDEDGDVIGFTKLTREIGGY
jgi:PAS domain S-box-containing protein